MRKSAILIIFLLINMIGYSNNISISGIDTSSMLYNGNIALYLNITDSKGFPVTGIVSDQINILESIDNGIFVEKDISVLTEGINETKGINIQLLIDNSGSMYDSIDGTETEIYGETRINSAISAIKTLINSMKGSNDKVGVSLFNTYYKEIVPMSSNRNLVLESLQMIEKPGKDESFTELNAALFSSAGDIFRNRGRKIIIVLSDGENYPYSIVRKQESPQFGADLYSTKSIVEELKLNSATLYAINFGTEKDVELEKMVIETGGFLYEADSESELSQIYKNIRDRVLSEYYLEYQTDTVYSDKKFVKAVLSEDSVESGTAFYFSGNLFGNPSLTFNWLFILTIPLSLLLLIFLAFQKLSDPAESAALEVTDFSGTTQVFNIKDNKTVIGSSDQDDITLTTSEQTTENNATIIFDDKKSIYTVVSEKEVLVNNNPVKTRILEPGDVISLDGATIVFNDKE